MGLGIVLMGGVRGVDDDRGGGNGDGDLAITQTAFAILAARSTTQSVPTPTLHATTPLPPTATPIPPTATLIPSLTSSPFPTHTPVPSSTPSPTALIPRITGFTFCDRPCNQANATVVTQFPPARHPGLYGFRLRGHVQRAEIQPGVVDERGGVGALRLRVAGTGAGHILPEAVGCGWPALGNLGGHDNHRGGGEFRGSVDIAGSYDFWDPAGHLPCQDW